MNDHIELDAFIASLGLNYMATFVPQSQSRNANEKHRSLNWRVNLSKGYGTEVHPARMVIETDYMQGIGHIPEDWQVRARHRGAHRNCIMIDNYERGVAESGRYGIAHQIKLPPPPLRDVLYGLVLDGSAADELFEDWCDNFGYDTDSRKAEETYNVCRDHGLKLRRMIGAENLGKLSELFQDY